MGKRRYKLVLFESDFGMSWSECVIAVVYHYRLAIKGHWTWFGKSSLTNTCYDHSRTFTSNILDTLNMAYLGISQSYLYICPYYGLYICVDVFAWWVIWNYIVLDFNNWILYGQSYSSPCWTWTCLVNIYIKYLINYILYF